MNTTSIIIIGAVFLVCFLLMIPAYYYAQRLKNRAAAFVENNKQRAVLRFYSDKATIDGKKLKAFDYSKGRDMEMVVALEPGKHTISGKFSAQDLAITGNQKYVMPKPVDINVELERGFIYTIGLYFEEPYEVAIETNSKVAAAHELKISGLLAKHKAAYIICLQSREYI